MREAAASAANIPPDGGFFYGENKSTGAAPDGGFATNWSKTYSAFLEKGWGLGVPPEIISTPVSGNFATGCRKQFPD